LGATGTTAGLIPTWYAATLPCNVFGVLDSEPMRALVPSHLIRSFNIGYLVVGVHDSSVRELVGSVGGLTLVKSTKDALIYEVQGVLPRAYFASRTYRYDEKDFLEGMLGNRAPVDAAYVGD